MERIVIFSCLFLGFYLLFYQGQILERLCILLKNTQTDMDMAARQRRLENKRHLLELQKYHTLWFQLERYLYYSGIRQRFPGISAESWMFGNLAVTGLVFLTAKALLSLRTTVIITVVFMVAEAILLRYLRLRNLRAVNRNMMKLLNFLKNYNITAAEATGVFNQISRYMEEPIRTALEECCLKTQVTGDAGRALLSMEEKIEHPEFKELARNIEISIRYCADFTTLVNSSRRSMREYLRYTQERKDMLREAAVKMFLLMAISPAALGVIFLLFWVQLQRVYS